MKHLVAVVVLLASLIACGSSLNADACATWQKANDAFTSAGDDATVGEKMVLQSEAMHALDDAIETATGDIRSSMEHLRAALNADPLDGDALADALQVVMLRCQDT